MLRLMAAMACLVATPALAAECHHFGDVITIDGRYGDADGTGAKVAARQGEVLFLDSAICVAADVISPGIAGAMSIQLHCPKIEVAHGTEVTVTGRLFGAHTGNGQTPVLLSCSL